MEDYIKEAEKVITTALIEANNEVRKKCVGRMIDAQLLGAITSIFTQHLTVAFNFIGWPVVASDIADILRIEFDRETKSISIDWDREKLAGIFPELKHVFYPTVEGVH